MGSRQIKEENWEGERVTNTKFKLNSTEYLIFIMKNHFELNIAISERFSQQGRKRPHHWNRCPISPMLFSKPYLQAIVSCAKIMVVVP